jgi:hypothetical protein
MQPVNPRNNECWLLAPLPGDPETGLAVLVLERGDDFIMAAPLFMDDDDALPGDRKLVPEPHFLAEESWVALGDAHRIPVAGFARRLGEIPRWQGAQLREAECEFPRGLPLLPWIGDKRAAARESLRTVLQSHAVSPALAAAIDLGKLVYDKAAGQWSRITNRLADAASAMAVLQSCLVPSGVRGGETLEKELTFAIPGGEAILRLESKEGGWILKLNSGSGIQTVELLDSAGAAHTGEAFGEWWLFGEDVPVAAGECRFSWRREGETPTFIVIELPSSEDAS